MKREPMNEPMICFISGIRRVEHHALPKGACPACEDSSCHKEVIEGGLILHELPAGMVLQIPPQLALDAYIGYIRMELSKPERSNLLEYKKAVFCNFSELPVGKVKYTPDEEYFPMDKNGAISIDFNVGGSPRRVKGFAIHIFSYEFDTEADEVALEE